MTSTPPHAAARFRAGGPGDVLRASSFDEALRAAIRARGLSLERLHVRLAERGIRVSLASLSNWQRGQCRPERSNSMHAVRALEQILGVPQGSLVARLGPPRPRGRWVRHAPGVLPYRDICEVHGSVDRLLEQIKSPADGQQLEWLSCHERFRVGPDRDELSVRTRLVMRARADGVDRHVALHHNEEALLPDLHHATFCRLGRVRTDSGDGVTAMELLFDRPLERGETYVVEYEFGYGGVGPYTSYYHRWFRFPAHEYLLQVEFDPAAPPIRCYRTHQAKVTAPSTDVQELRPTSWHMVHVAELEVKPGVHGIRWEWD